MRPATLGLLACIAAAAAAACDRGRPPDTRPRITVLAAASTTDVLRRAGRLFEERFGVEVAFSFSASSVLARQVAAGAPADVLVCADERWMTHVAEAGAIRPGSRCNLLANDLVMVAPLGAGFEAATDADFDFAARLPQVRRIAVGDPEHVPAGRYARQALTALGWWDDLRERLLPAPDVRAALRLVEIGEADAGIVYATDAARSESVVVVAAFPGGLHEPIRYPAALCSDSPDAARFLEFLGSDEMLEVFKRAGFRGPGAGPC